VQTIADKKPREPIDIARVVAAATLQVSGVASLSSGRFAEVATYGPQEKVPGVVVSQSAEALRLEIHVVAAYSPTMDLPQIAQDIRVAARASIEEPGADQPTNVDVIIDDLAFSESKQ
jgi:uncharacterized alkaline shock family protein YloU